MANLNEMTSKELLGRVFGFREDDERPSEYIQRINEEIRSKVGFTEYHQEINQILKEGSTRQEWQYICAHIKGYEKHWVKALKTYTLENYELLTN